MVAGARSGSVTGRPKLTEVNGMALAAVSCSSSARTIQRPLALSVPRSPPLMDRVTMAGPLALGSRAWKPAQSRVRSDGEASGAPKPIVNERMYQSTCTTPPVGGPHRRSVAPSSADTTTEVSARFSR